MFVKRKKIRFTPAYCLAALFCLNASVSSTTAQATPQHGSIRDLERRARSAQALAEQVQTLQTQLEELQKVAQDAESTIANQQETIEKQNERLTQQDKTLEEQQRQITNRDIMLRLFRSGDFEYYQVAEGDSLTSIAANPMVYGDAQRAIWLAYANALEKDATLRPGTVIIIPRFAEGVQYDF